MCIERIKRLFSWRQSKEVREQILDKILEGKRRIIPYRVGPNMPKHQPCPTHRAMAKRESKTVGGAFYCCSKYRHRFFVLSPSFRR